MNVTEANHLNTLLRWLLGEPDAMGHVPHAEDAETAAVALTQRAHKTLAAGLTPTEVADAWERLEIPGWYDDDPVPFRPVQDTVSDRLVDPDGPQTPAEYRRRGPADSRTGETLSGRVMWP